MSYDSMSKTNLFCLRTDGVSYDSMSKTNLFCWRTVTVCPMIV